MFAASAAQAAAGALLVLRRRREAERVRIGAAWAAGIAIVLAVVLWLGEGVDF